MRPRIHCDAKSAPFSPTLGQPGVLCAYSILQGPCARTYVRAGHRLRVLESRQLKPLARVFQGRAPETPRMFQTEG